MAMRKLIGQVDAVHDRIETQKPKAAGSVRPPNANREANMTFDPPAALVWFRRDLRDYDHAALDAAADAGRAPTVPSSSIGKIPDVPPGRRDRRLHYIRNPVEPIVPLPQGGIDVREGMARAKLRLAREPGVSAVVVNRGLLSPPPIGQDAPLPLP